MLGHKEEKEAATQARVDVVLEERGDNPKIDWEPGIPNNNSKHSHNHKVPATSNVGTVVRMDTCNRTVHNNRIVPPRHPKLPIAVHQSPLLLPFLKPTNLLKGSIFQVPLLA